MQGRKPTHRAFLVEDKGDQQDPFWREVAPAWQHQDGKGMDLFIPAGMALTGRIVIREQSERPTEQPRRDRGQQPRR